MRPASARRRKPTGEVPGIGRLEEWPSTTESGLHLPVSTSPLPRRRAAGANLFCRRFVLKRFSRRNASSAIPFVFFVNSYSKNDGDNPDPK